MSGTSLTSVELKWSPPPRDQRNGAIVQYEVLYHPTSSNVDDVLRNTTQTRLNIARLRKDTTYIFQVKAYTSQGAGPWSDRITHTTHNLGSNPSPNNTPNIFK